MGNYSMLAAQANRHNKGCGCRTLMTWVGFAVVIGLFSLGLCGLITLFAIT